MSFFESSIVKEEIKEISKLGDLISGEHEKMFALSHSERTKRINTLQDMLNKTKIFCTRLSLSDDKEAKEMCEQLRECAKIMGKENIMEALSDVEILLKQMESTIDNE